MSELIHTAIIVAAVLFPFIAMPLMWRRMKRVRAEAYRACKTQHHETEWQETVATHDGLNVDRVNRPNDELIELGDRARHTHWPISNP